MMGLFGERKHSQRNTIVILLLLTIANATPCLTLNNDIPHTTVTEDVKSDTPLSSDTPTINPQATPVTNNDLEDIKTGRTEEEGINIPIDDHVNNAEVHNTDENIKNTINRETIASQVTSTDVDSSHIDNIDTINSNTVEDIINERDTAVVLETPSDEPIASNDVNTLSDCITDCTSEMYSVSVDVSEGGACCDDATPIEKEGLDEDKSDGEHPDEVKGEGSKEGEEPTDEEPDDIVTFEEFKNKINQENSRSQQVGPSLNTLPPRQAYHNYALSECGAKVLESNKEAKNAGSILLENKDMYMLNPCSANIWFVIELCELVSVSILEISCFELFSSIPETIAVYTSDSYPDPKWEKLGTFTLHDERGTHKFPLEDSVYTKYIMFEMLSYFGTEHYCPISTVKVLGSTLIEDYEFTESQRDGVNGNSHSRDTSEKIITNDDSYSSSDTSNASGNPIKAATVAILSVIEKAVNGLMSPDDATDYSDDEMFEQNSIDHNGDSAEVVTGENTRSADDIGDYPSSTHQEQTTSITTSSRMNTLTAPASSEELYLSIEPTRPLQHELPEPETNEATSETHSGTRIIPNPTHSSQLPLGPDEVTTVPSNSETISTIINDEHTMSLSTSNNISATVSQTTPSSITTETVAKIEVNESIHNTEQNIVHSTSITLSNSSDTVIMQSDVSPPAVTIDTVPLSDNDVLTTGVESDTNKSDAVQISKNLTNGEEHVQNNSNNSTEECNNDESKTLPNVNESMSEENVDGAVVNGSMQSTVSREKSVFVRLSNRINMLEVNMTLFDSYLAQISQSLKKNKNRTEDMQKTLEKRMVIINDTLQTIKDQIHMNVSIIENMLFGLADLNQHLLYQNEEWITLVNTITLFMIVVLFIQFTLMIFCCCFKYFDASRVRNLEASLTRIETQLKDIVVQLKNGEHLQTTSNKHKGRRSSSHGPIFNKTPPTTLTGYQETSMQSSFSTPNLSSISSSSVSHDDSRDSNHETVKWKKVEFKKSKKTSFKKLAEQ